MARHRLQFDFSESGLATIDTLVESTGAATRAEVLRRALSVFDYMVYKAMKNQPVIIEPAEVRVITGVKKEGE